MIQQFAYKTVACQLAIHFFMVSGFAVTCFGQDKVGQDKVGQDKVGQDKVGQDKVSNLEAGYDKSLVYRVDSQIEHTGSLVIRSYDKEKEDQQFSLDVKARLGYHERFIGSAAKPQSVRLYDQAKGDFQIDTGKLTTELSEKNRLIVARIKSDEGNRYQFASINDVLEQRELELLRYPCDPLAFPALLNKEKVQTGDEWEVGKDELARLVGVDSVIYSTVKLVLKEIDETSAKIHIVGKLKAEVDDTLTEMGIAGVILLDREKRLAKSVRLTVNEKRRAAQIAPGFDGQTKIDISIATGKDIPELSTDELKRIAKTKTIRSILKWAEEKGSFELKYDPSWKMITSDNEAAILRFVDNGDLLTQCSIVRLASRPVDKPLSLDEFKGEVAKVIAKDTSSRIEQAEESTNLNGLKTLKVLVRGIEEQIPMNWLYYNIASPDGRQVTFVFMLEEAVFSRVVDPAQRLVDGFQFNSRENQMKFHIDKSGEVKRDASKANSPIVR